MILQRKPPGLLMILDEECSFPRASDDTMVEKFHASYASHKAYTRPPGNEVCAGDDFGSSPPPVRVLRPYNPMSSLTPHRRPFE